MSAWPKWIVGTALILVAAFVSLVYGLYWQGASALPRELPRAQHHYSDDVHGIYWASLGGEGPMRVERLDPLKLCWKVLHAVSIDDPKPLGPRASHSLMSEAARLIVSRARTDSRPANRIVAEIATMIRLSNEWRPEQIADYSLDTAWFGRNARGLRAAAPAYFGVPADRLTRAETIALVGMMKFPSREPTRNREQFNERYAYLAGELGIDPTYIHPERDLARLTPAVITH